MMLTTWPMRALFKYVFRRVLGTFIKTDVNLDDIDFSLQSFSISDLEMNTFEINKLLHSDPSKPSPFKLVNMTIKSVNIPWSILKFNWADISIKGVEIDLMPSPTRTNKFTDSEEKISEESKDDSDTADTYDSEVSLSSSLVTKFLSNIGLKIQNVVIKLLPLQFGKEHDNYENLPTMMFRLNHLVFEKQGDLFQRSESVNIDMPPPEREVKLTQSISTQDESVVVEAPTPSMLKILKKKVIRLGQMSVHLLSSAIGSEIYINQAKYDGLEFPFTFPPVMHLSTLL